MNLFDIFGSEKKQSVEEACWKGYHKEGMKTMFGKRYPNCVKNKNESLETYINKGECPGCGGVMVSEEQINEKQDACYHKVKSRYKVWPSAYASGALVQCRKKGAANWGNKSESSLNEFAPNDNGDSDEGDTLLKYAKLWYNGNLETQQQVEQLLARSGWEIGELESEEGGAFVVQSGDENGDSYIGFTAADLTDEHLDENLKKWFKEKWVRFGPDGKIRGDCARGDESEGKPKCLPQSKAHALGKKGRASAASRKRREDPNPERSGAAINVATKKKTNEAGQERALEEGVNDNFLYHATQPAGIMRILRTGAIKASYRPQAVTKSRTQYPTVSTTRSKQYAESNEFVDFLNLPPEGNAVILVLDRTAIANHYKMFSTSQGTQTIGDEFEEVIVVPKGSMPIKGTLLGFYFNPKKMNEIKEYENIPWFKELFNSPYYLDQKQKIGNKQGVAEGLTKKARARKEAEAVMAVIKRLEAELKDPNPHLDKADIQRRLDNEKRRLELYRDVLDEQGVTEAVGTKNPLFSGWLAMTYSRESATKKFPSNVRSKKGKDLNKPMSRDDFDINDIEIDNDDISNELSEYLWDNFRLSSAGSGAGKGYSEHFWHLPTLRGFNNGLELGKRLLAGESAIKNWFDQHNRSLRKIGLPEYRVECWGGITSPIWHSDEKSDVIADLDELRAIYNGQAKLGDFWNRGIEGRLNELAPNPGGGDGGGRDDGDDGFELPLDFKGQNIMVWPRNKKHSMGDTATPFPRGERFTGKVYIMWDRPKIEAIWYLDPKDREDREKEYERVYGPRGRGYEDWLDHKWYDTTGVRYRFVTDWRLIPAKEPGGWPGIVDAWGQDMKGEVMNYPESFITEIIQKDGDGRHFVEPRQSVAEDQLNEFAPTKFIGNFNRGDGGAGRGGGDGDDDRNERDDSDDEGIINKILQALERLQPDLFETYGGEVEDVVVNLVSNGRLDDYVRAVGMGNIPMKELIKQGVIQTIKELKELYGDQGVAEGFTDDINLVYAMHPQPEESERVAIGILDKDEDEFIAAWQRLPAEYQEEFNFDLPLWDTDDFDRPEYKHITLKAMNFNEYVKLVGNYIGSEEMSHSAMSALKRNQLAEKWSQKYKRSIDCSNPKGFSQRAHCDGKKKNEAVNESKKYYSVIGTDPAVLRKDFNMSKDRNGWYLKENSTPKQKLDVYRAFGNPI